MSTLKTSSKLFSEILFSLNVPMVIIANPLEIIVATSVALYLIQKVIGNKKNHKISWIDKLGIVIGGLLLFGFASKFYKKYADKKNDPIVAEASDLINNGDIEGALVKLEEAKSKYSSASNNATELEKEIYNSQSIDFAKESLARISEDDFQKLKNDVFDEKILNQPTLNKDLIALMKEHASEREKIITEIKVKEEQEKLVLEKADRKRKIEKELFSAWDGSHRGLSKFIKDNMNDPDSYEHIETKYSDQGTHLFVDMKFRGANAFGAKVINRVTANCDYDGNVLKVLSQN